VHPGATVARRERGRGCNLHRPHLNPAAPPATLSTRMAASALPQYMSGRRGGRPGPHPRPQPPLEERRAPSSFTVLPRGGTRPGRENKGHHQHHRGLFCHRHKFSLPPNADPGRRPSQRAVVDASMAAVLIPLV
jgi:hypothetical protein